MRRYYGKWPMCERCGEYEATDVDDLCDFCGEDDNLRYTEAMIESATNPLEGKTDD